MVLVDPDKPLVVQVPTDTPRKEVRHKQLLSGITVFVEDHTAQKLSDALARQEGRWFEHTMAQAEAQKVEVSKSIKTTATVTASTAVTSSAARSAAAKSTVTSAIAPVRTTITVTSSTSEPIVTTITVMSSASEPIATTATVMSSATGPVGVPADVASTTAGPIVATATVTSSASRQVASTMTVTSCNQMTSISSATSPAVSVVEKAGAESRSLVLTGTTSPLSSQSLDVSTSDVSTSVAAVLLTSSSATTVVAVFSASAETSKVRTEATPNAGVSKAEMPQTPSVKQASATSIAIVSVSSPNSVTSPSVTSSASVVAPSLMSTTAGSTSETSSPAVTSQLTLRSTSPLSDIGIFDYTPNDASTSTIVPSVTQNKSVKSVQSHNSSKSNKPRTVSSAKGSALHELPKTSAKIQDKSIDSKELTHSVGKSSQTQAIESSRPKSPEMSSAGDRVRETLEKLKKMKCGVPKIIGLPFRDLVILDTMSHIHDEKDAASILQQTAKYNDVEINFLYESIADEQWKCRVEVKEVVLAEVRAEKKMDAHKAAAEKCLERLQNMCWTVHEKHPSAMDPATGNYNMCALK